MIRITKMREAYDRTRIRSYMKRLGFEETNTPFTYEYENSGLIVFQKHVWKIEFVYPSETLTFAAVKGCNGSYFAVKWSELDKIECTSDMLSVVEKNGSEVRLWSR